MAAGILLVTHLGIGTALVAVAGRLLGPLPLAVEAFEVSYDADPDAMLPAASAALRRVDRGDGNLAARLARLGTPVRRVSAVSLPMLLRVLNYPELPLDELPAVAAAGARNGVVHDDA
jgi:PTS system mannose-specific IIA component